jgi:hypothetical protein
VRQAPRDHAPSHAGSSDAARERANPAESTAPAGETSRALQCADRGAARRGAGRSPRGAWPVATQLLTPCRAARARPEPAEATALAGEALRALQAAGAGGATRGGSLIDALVLERASPRTRGLLTAYQEHHAAVRARARGLPCLRSALHACLGMRGQFAAKREHCAAICPTMRLVPAFQLDAERVMPCLWDGGWPARR